MIFAIAQKNYFWNDFAVSNRDESQIFLFLGLAYRSVALHHRTVLGFVPIRCHFHPLKKFMHVKEIYYFGPPSLFIKIYLIGQLVLMAPTLSKMYECEPKLSNLSVFRGNLKDGHVG